MLSTPSCASETSSRRESSSGPISEMVARMGWPCSPKRSQKQVVNLSGPQVMSSCFTRSAMKDFSSPDGGDARKVALDVGGKDGNPGIGKALGQNLKGHGLAGACCAGHEAVAVAEFQGQVLRAVTIAEIDETLFVTIGCHSLSIRMIMRLPFM